MLNKDYRDILLSLDAEKAEYILVGAYALAAHGYPRATMDIDIITGASGLLFEKAKENAVKVKIDGLEIMVLSLKDLIKNKITSGRPKDLLDAEMLKSTASN
ncbi:MAG: hypothetical protein WAX69_04015 [Victivallales bacterium]